uniref:Uncharacterized protein n=1 Tax=Romanomermis culicivorax TaxID=13658 RepID=A0A915J0U8_ROMCU
MATGVAIDGDADCDFCGISLPILALVHFNAFGQFKNVQASHAHFCGKKSAFEAPVFAVEETAHSVADDIGISGIAVVASVGGLAPRDQEAGFDAAAQNATLRRRII